MAKRSMPMSPTAKRVAKAKKTPTPNASERARTRANANARFKRTASPAAKAHVRKKVAKRFYGH